MKTITKTEEVISSMLKENTGAALLDSGGHYGRHWERNQEREFESEPRATLDTWSGEPTINLYHYLSDRLTYVEEEDKAFHAWAKDQDDYWLSLMEEYPDAIGGKYEHTINSYNGESMLSQVIQYVVYSNENDEPRILLQIHNGCDVRGGYTAPRVFAPEDSDLGLYGESASIVCTNKECYFVMDWRGEWTDRDGASTDFKPWEYADEVRKQEGKLDYLPCPTCKAPLAADAWNTI